MSCLKLAFLAGAALMAAGSTALAMEPMSDEEIIASAEKAAPESVAKKATIIAMDDKMQMRTVREGANGFTCMADNPQTPGTDPMCLDKGGMEWAGAWMKGSSGSATCWREDRMPAIRTRTRRSRPRKASGWIRARTS